MCPKETFLFHELGLEIIAIYRSDCVVLGTRAVSRAMKLRDKKKARPAFTLLSFIG